MGFGAAIGGIVSGLASSAGGIIGSLTQKGPNLGEYSSRLNKAANQYIVPFSGTSNPYWNIDIPGMASQAIDFGLSNVQPINMSNMQQLQMLLNTAMPGYMNTVQGMQGALGNAFGMLPQMAAPIPSLLAGQVPQDVQDQIRRSAAFSSLMGGTAGAGLGTTGAITARDLGLTSLDLEKMGQGQAAQYASTTTGLLREGSNLISMARNYLMPQPVNPLSLLPLSDLIQGTEWQKEALYQANLASYTAKANAAAAAIGAPPTNVAAGIGGAISGLFGSKGGQDLISGIGNLFGGGGGGGAQVPAVGGGTTSPLFPSDITSSVSYSF